MWLIDQLQKLVLENHRCVLYPSWSNTSKFKETCESFDNASIHSAGLYEALNDHWENRAVKNIELMSDQKYFVLINGD
jgi:hypothetical protein